MKTYVFVIQTAYLTDIDFGCQAENIDEAWAIAEKQWPPAHGHRIFFSYKY